MSDYKEQLDRILLTIPYEKIRQAVFEALKKDGILSGEHSDINFLVLEQVDHFKMKYEKRIKQQCWDAIFRQIRKTLGSDLRNWYDSKVAEGFADSLKTISEEMCDQLEGCDIGEAGA
jgi:hypothetical protein